MDEYSIKLLHYFQLFSISHVEKICMVLHNKISFNNSSWMKLTIYVIQFTKTLKILKLSAQSSFFLNYLLEDVFEIWWQGSSPPIESPENLTVTCLESGIRQMDWADEVKGFLLPGSGRPLIPSAPAIAGQCLHLLSGPLSTGLGMHWHPSTPQVRGSPIIFCNHRTHCLGAL